METLKIWFLSNLGHLQVLEEIQIYLGLLRLRVVDLVQKVKL